MAVKAPLAGPARGCVADACARVAPSSPPAPRTSGVLPAPSAPASPAVKTGSLGGWLKSLFR